MTDKGDLMSTASLKKRIDVALVEVALARLVDRFGLELQIARDRTHSELSFRAADAGPQTFTHIGSYGPEGHTLIPHLGNDPEFPH